MKLQQHSFTLEGSSEVFNGYYESPKKWNGFDCPMFKKKDLNKIIKELEKQGFEIKDNKIIYEEEEVDSISFTHNYVNSVYTKLYFFNNIYFNKED